MNVNVQGKRRTLPTHCFDVQLVAPVTFSLSAAVLIRLNAVVLVVSGSLPHPSVRPSVRLSVHSLPFIDLEHLLGEGGEVVVSVDGEGADVQHRQVGGELLEKSATPGVPHLEQNKAFIDHTL